MQICFSLVFHNSNRNFSDGVWGIPTQQVAELEAAIQAVKIAGRNGITHLQIRTDSTTMADLYYRYKDIWMDNNWSEPNGGLVKDRDKFIDLRNAITNLKVEVEMVKLRRRVNDHLSDHCNQLASFAIHRCASRFELISSDSDSE